MIQVHFGNQPSVIFQFWSSQKTSQAFAFELTSFWWLANMIKLNWRWSGISLLPTCHYQPSENVCYWVTSFFSFSKLSLQALHSAGLVCKKLATCSPDAAVDLEIFRYKKKYFVMTRDSWPRSSSRTQRGDKWRLWRENVTHSRRAAAAWEPGH